jgi:hypothetical protein
MERRVISIHNRWRVNKEWNEERIQYLQEKVLRIFTFFGILSKYYWKTIDSEIVPSNVWLQKAVFGDELTGWKSKFKQYIK